MKFCAYCGAKLKDEDKFCLMCGEKCIDFFDENEEYASSLEVENKRLEEEKLEAERKAKEEAERKKPVLKPKKKLDLKLKD